MKTTSARPTTAHIAASLTQMPPVIGRIFAVGLVLATLLGVPAEGVCAEVPPGPRLAFLRWNLGAPPAVEVDTAAPDGSAVQLLAGGGLSSVPLPDLNAGISWSPDGASLAFVNGLAPERATYQPGSVYIVPAGGGTAIEVPGSEGATNPVFAPDGRSLAVERTRTRPARRGSRQRGGPQMTFEFSVWLLGLEGGFIRRLTRWRPRATVPASFSPGGRTLAITRLDRRGRKDAVAISLHGGRTRLIAADAANPVYSPNGKQLAVVRPGFLTTDIYVGKSDGSHLRRISDGEAEHWPTWDPSGRRLAFVRYDGKVFPQSLLGIGDTLVEINADGSCERKISSAGSVAVIAPAWQPGPSREAGRIAC
jgi:Tol biopolymer transport system component